MELLPDEIQESVSSLYWFDVSAVCHGAVPAAFPRPDDHHDDDADEHCDQGGHHVVHHRTHAHLTRRFAVKGGNTWESGNSSECSICSLRAQ